MLFRITILKCLIRNLLICTGWQHSDKDVKYGEPRPYLNEKLCFYLATSLADDSVCAKTLFSRYHPVAIYHGITCDSRLTYPRVL